MRMMSEAVCSYYAGLGERERAQLTTPVGAIEFATGQGGDQRRTVW
jgi:hypothetical protein